VPNVKLSPVLKIFTKNTKASLSLAKEAALYKELRKGKYRPILDSRLQSINELSFLKLFISWEHFLEEAFIRFMCGARNSAGLPQAKYVNPSNLGHALDMIKQKQRFVDWTVGGDVIERALLCFKDGEPFSTALGGSLTYLMDMKTIRNRIAHESKEAEEAFQNMIRQKMGYVPQGIGVGKLLMSKIPRSNPMVLLEEYGNVLLTAANLLAT
jgi:hypothetical protein